MLGPSSQMAAGRAPGKPAEHLPPRKHDDRKGHILRVCDLFVQGVDLCCGDTVCAHQGRGNSHARKEHRGFHTHAPCCRRSTHGLSQAATPTRPSFRTYARPTLPTWHTTRKGELRPRPWVETHSGEPPKTGLPRDVLRLHTQTRIASPLIVLRHTSRPTWQRSDASARPGRWQAPIPRIKPTPSSFQRPVAASEQQNCPPPSRSGSRLSDTGQLATEST